jgi:hypothetical protein
MNCIEPVNYSIYSTGTELKRLFETFETLWTHQFDKMTAAATLHHRLQTARWGRKRRREHPLGTFLAQPDPHS